jgi:hypothetical protein
LWGNTSEAMDKSPGADASGGYVPETPASLQRPLPPLSTSYPVAVRCDFAEQGERLEGGNGYLGHDETSEPFDQTFKRAKLATPGAPNTPCTP